MKIPWRWIFLFLIITCSACSTVSQKIHPATKPGEIAESEILLSEISRRNGALKTFKGAGKVNIVRNGESFTARAAWLGSAPEKFRIELFGAPGQPKVGFACDGQWLYYYDHQDKAVPVKKIPADNSGLRRFTSISITVSDIVSILSGRIPAYAYHSSEILKTESSEGSVLVLHKKWWMGNQKIYLTADKQGIEKIEVYNGNILGYRVEFRGVQSVNSYHIPKRLIITDSNGNRLRIDTERFWADAEVSPELFVLRSETP